MKTWRGRYIVNVYVRAEDSDAMDEQDTEGREALERVAEGVRSALETIGDVLDGVDADLEGLIDCRDVTGEEDDPFRWQHEEEPD